MSEFVIGFDGFLTVYCMAVEAGTGMAVMAVGVGGGSSSSSASCRGCRIIISRTPGCVSSSSSSGMTTAFGGRGHVSGSLIRGGFGLVGVSLPSMIGFKPAA